MMGDGPGCLEEGADLLGNRRFRIHLPPAASQERIVAGGRRDCSVG